MFIFRSDEKEIADKLCKDLIAKFGKHFRVKPMTVQKTFERVYFVLYNAPSHPIENEISILEYVRKRK